MAHPEMSVQSLASFLETAEKKGWLSPATASAMRSNVTRVLEVLEPQDRNDVSTIDLDAAIRRFSNLNSEISSESLRTYRSRIESAIRHFVDWRRDPSTWSPKSKGSAESRGGSHKVGGAARRKSVSRSDSPPKTPPLSSGPTTAALTYPYPLRENVTVTLYNVPRDLKLLEADRIAAFLRSLAEDYKP